MARYDGLKVAMLATPWLSMPPTGYGGIEYVVHYLTVELRRLGVDVELFATGDTTTPVNVLHHTYAKGRYADIARPLYDAVPIPLTHLLEAFQTIASDGTFDIVHDHNGFLGPALATMSDPMLFPPMLHTLHGPFTPDAIVARGVPDNRPMYRNLAHSPRLRFAAISRAQLADAPSELLPRVAGVVHNAINVSDYPFRAEKQNYCITLARIARDKGQALAARVCRQLGMPLRMAGLVNGIGDPAEVEREANNAASRHRGNDDFQYWRNDVAPLVEPGRVDFVGNMAGQAKLDFIADARALLFPIDWEEPFGLAVIEALACGTPVVAMRRGAIPEIIQHGVNGFLANNEAEFSHYLSRIDEIDRHECRRSVEARFSAAAMAAGYLKCYEGMLDELGRSWRLKSPQTRISERLTGELTSSTTLASARRTPSPLHDVPLDEQPVGAR